MSDYISREAVLEKAEYDGNYRLVVPVEAIKGLPAADVELVRNGRWEECDWVDVDEHGFGTRRTFKAGLRCSQCACVFKKELLWKRNWCPNCGAKWKVVQTDDAMQR